MTDSNTHICPFLGAEDDPSTRYSFAGTGNYCHKVQRPETIDLIYQQSFCLTHKHTQCAVFAAQQAPRVLPREIAAGNADSAMQGRSWGWAAMILVVIAFGALLTFGLPAILDAGSLQAPATLVAERLPDATETALVAQRPIVGTSTFTPSPTVTPSATPQPTATSTFTASPVPSFTPTATPVTPTPIAAFGTPFGPGQALILYRVAGGETWNTVANKFRTTPEILITLNNWAQGKGLWVDAVLVIPNPEVVAPQSLPQFKVIQVSGEVAIANLAQSLGVSESDLRFYNGLADDELVLVKNRWVIYPLP